MLAVEVAVAANVGEVTVITLVAAVAQSTCNQIGPFTSTECKAVAGIPSYNVQHSNNCNQWILMVIRTLVRRGLKITKLIIADSLICTGVITSQY